MLTLLFVLRSSFFFPVLRKSWAFASEVVRLVALVPLGSFAVSLWGTYQISYAITAQPPSDLILCRVVSCVCMHLVWCTQMRVRTWVNGRPALRRGRSSRHSTYSPSGPAWRDHLSPRSWDAPIENKHLLTRPNSTASRFGHVEADHAQPSCPPASHFFLFSAIEIDF